ncbi:MAG: motility protein A [Chitinivibrionales bacterium]|nr:motility protein A [Chitinivibrionales bacterium]
MDIALVLGLITGFGMLIIGYMIEGGSPAALFAISPIFIVVGGTLGAVMTQFRMRDVLGIPQKMKYALFDQGMDSSEIVDLLVSFSERARREGILSLESDFATKLSDPRYDPMLLKGTRLAIDGTETDLINDILENEIFFFENKKKHDASLFEAAGGYSPTMGIIGTVMGLVMVLGNLDKPDELGPAIAAAFIATLYGVSLANLVYLPIAGKIKNKAKQGVIQKQLIKEGIMAIQAGENPHLIREKLEIFCENYKGNKAAEAAKEKESQAGKKK